MCRFCHWLWQCWGWWRPRWGCSYQSAEPECQWGSRCVAWRSASGTQTLGTSGTSGAAHTHTHPSASWSYKQFIHPPIHHSFTIHTIIHSPIHLPIHQFINPFINQFTHLNSYMSATTTTLDALTSLPHSFGYILGLCNVPDVFWVCVLCMMYIAYSLDLCNVPDV